LVVRAMALQWNFHPYGARLRRDQPSRVSPFHDLNGFQYHPNWLHNLLIASVVYLIFLHAACTAHEVRTPGHPCGAT